MTRFFSRYNHLFELARTGRRLPHLVTAVILSFVFILVAQLTGGTLAVLIILALSTSGTDAPLNNTEALNSVLMPDTAVEQAILLILAFGPIFLILWLWLALFEKRPLWTIGVEGHGAIQKYLRGLLVGLLMFVTAIGISAAFGYIAVEAGDPQQQGAAALGGVLLVLLGWVVQGSAEEAVTRGWLLPVIGARHSPALGIIVSALVFTIFHSLNPNLNPLAVFNLFLFGLFTAFYALYEGGLWGVFSLHTAWNWAQGNLFGFEVSGQPSPGGTLFDLMEVGPDFVTGGRFGPEGGVSVTLVLIIGCLVILWAGKRHVPVTDKVQFEDSEF